MFVNYVTPKLPTTCSFKFTRKEKTMLQAKLFMVVNNFRSFERRKCILIFFFSELPTNLEIWELMRDFFQMFLYMHLGTKFKQLFLDIWLYGFDIKLLDVISRALKIAKIFQKTQKLISTTNSNILVPPEGIIILKKSLF